MTRRSSALATAVDRGDRHLSPDATRHPDSDHEDPVGGFTIGELARDHGVTLRALRFYEARGLVQPLRTAGRALSPLRVRKAAPTA